MQRALSNQIVRLDGVLKLLQNAWIFERRNILRDLFTLSERAQQATHDFSRTRFGELGRPLNDLWGGDGANFMSNELD